MASEVAEFRASNNNVLEACGDLILRVGSEPSRLVPNPGVDTSELNRQIQAYQKLLDKMELEIRQSIEMANAPAPPPPAAESLAKTDDSSKNGFDTNAEVNLVDDPEMPELDMSNLGALGGLEHDDLGFGDLLGGQPVDDQINFVDYDL